MSLSQKILTYIVVILYFGAAYYISAKLCRLVARRWPKIMDSNLRTIVIWAFFIVLLIPIILWMNNNL